jgi:hypothetical protein
MVVMVGFNFRLDFLMWLLDMYILHNAPDHTGYSLTHLDRFFSGEQWQDWLHTQMVIPEDSFHPLPTMSLYWEDQQQYLFTRFLGRQFPGTRRDELIAPRKAAWQRLNQIELGCDRSPPSLRDYLYQTFRSVLDDFYVKDEMLNDLIDFYLPLGVLHCMNFRESLHEYFEDFFNDLAESEIRPVIIHTRTPRLYRHGSVIVIGADLGRSDKDEFISFLSSNELRICLDSAS